MSRTVAIAALLSVIAVGLLAAVTIRAGDGSTESATDVRVNVLRQDDGDVLVAVQQRQANGTWGERQRPRLNRLPAEAPTGRWHASSALSVFGEPSSAGEFYVGRKAQPTRQLTVAEYLAYCSDVSDLGEAVAAYLSGATAAGPTWGQYLAAVETVIESLRTTAPPPELDAYHAALTRLAISTAQYAVLQPPAAIMDSADLAAPFSLDGPALAAAEQSLDDALANRMRDSGCIES